MELHAKEGKDIITTNMSLERRSTNPNEVQNPSTVAISWTGSQSAIAGFVREAFRYERSRDEAFFEKTQDLTSGGLTLLYDLGSYRYSLYMGDFPNRIDLTVPKPKSVDLGANLVTVASFSQFYKQIIDKADRYVIETYSKRDNLSERPDSWWKKEIEALRALEKQLKDSPIAIKFESRTPMDYLYQITHIEDRRGYSYRKYT